MYMHTVAHRGQRELDRFPGTGVMGQYELADGDIGHQT